MYEYLLIGNVLYDKLVHENVHIYETEIQNIFSLSEKKQQETIFVFWKKVEFHVHVCFIRVIEVEATGRDSCHQLLHTAGCLLCSIIPTSKS